MANNYLDFSFMLPLPEGKTRADLEAFAQEYQAAADAAEEADEEAWHETYCGVAYEIEARGLWVHAPYSEGNLDAAVHLTQAFLRHFALPTHGVIIAWAATCSKPRIGEFTGGAVLVTAEDFWSADPEWYCAQEAQRRQLTRL